MNVVYTLLQPICSIAHFY